MINGLIFICNGVCIKKQILLQVLPPDYHALIVVCKDKN